jgi:hypothetical protein
MVRTLSVSGKGVWRRTVVEGGLSAAEVGKEISEHGKSRSEHHDRRIAIIEAVLLAVVAVLAAWSGYSSAKWSTESRLKLAQASTARTEASSNELAALSQRNFDSSTFEAWFVAYVLGDAQKEAIAIRRFTPNFLVAFNAWMATHPDTNSLAPPGPTYMPEYQQPKQDAANALNQKANQLYIEGSTDANNSDRFVRITVYFATVLFLVAISGHFRVRSVRIGLICVGVVVLVFSVIQLAGLPLPPT